MPRPATDELSEGHDRLQTLATRSSTVVWYTAPDGAVTQPNPSWQAFTGQSFEACRGWGWAEAIHPDDRNAVTEAWRIATRDRSPFENLYRLRRHDGEYRHVQAQGSPVLDGDHVREWVGVCFDVTATLQARIALQESELRFRFLDRLGQATRSVNDAGQVMEITARLLGEYLGATRCAYADVESDSNRFTIRNDWSVPGVASSAGVYSLELFGPQATSNLRQGRHLVVRDVDRELGDEGGGRMFNAIGIKAIICAGLVKEGRLVAMMAVHRRSRVPGPSRRSRWSARWWNAAGPTSSGCATTPCCASRTGARTNSWPRWRTSCATRWRRSSTPWRCCGAPTIRSGSRGRAR